MRSSAASRRAAVVRSWWCFLALVATGAAVLGEKGQPPADGSAYVIVLGMAQDGGVPQTGTKQHPGWEDERFRRFVTCIAIVDERSRQRWMVDATPDFPEQLHLLDQLVPVEATPGLDGILLTHAHMGHYTGLMHLGHEALGARRVPVYAMPRMLKYLSTNGPWDQLVRYGNIELRPLKDHVTVRLNERISASPMLVPHRQEYSEVVGFRIQGPHRALVYIPDIDRWEQWDGWGTRIEDVIAKTDIALLDGSFYANGEIPGRDMSGFPHPFIIHSMERFARLAPAERAKIYFTHLNHTNPALRPDSEQRESIEGKGFHVAERKQRFGL